MTGATLQHASSRPLGLLDSVQLTSETASRLRALDGYDLSAVVHRIKRQQVLPERLLEDAVYEFKRLMSLCVLGHHGIIVPCDEVDEVWHTFMLFTREYTHFCQTIAGGFIHHSPPESTLPTPAGEEDFLTLYRRYFGPCGESPIQQQYLKAKPSICQSSVACGIA